MLTLLTFYDLSKNIYEQINIKGCFIYMEGKMYKFVEIEELLEPKGNYTLAYSEWGDPKAKKVLFCVHGILRNRHDFDYLAQSLADHYRVICVDMVGRGQSSWLENPSNYNYHFYTRGMIQMLEKLDIDTVDWLGSSMGGIIGMMVAAKDRKRINKMVLNDVGPYVDGNVIFNITKYITKHYEFDNYQDASDYIHILLSPFGIKNSEDIWDHVLKNSLKKADNGKFMLSYDSKIYEGLQERLVNVADVNMWDEWDKIDIPVLVLRGERSKFLTEKTLELMVEGRNNVNYKIYPGVGHTPSLMYFDQVADVRNWLLG